MKTKNIISLLLILVTLSFNSIILKSNYEKIPTKISFLGKEYILDKGGCILVAIYEKKAVGVCALIKMNEAEWDFELAKMAISSEFRGLGIGFLLANAIIDKAKYLGAKSIYLESNTVLAPAIKLYRKLGFKEIAGYPTPYQRCDIQMMLNIL